MSLSNTTVKQSSTILLYGGSSNVAYEDSTFNGFQLLYTGDHSTVNVEATPPITPPSHINTVFTQSVLLLVGANSQITISPDNTSDTTTFNEGGTIIGLGTGVTLKRKASRAITPKPLNLYSVTILP